MHSDHGDLEAVLTCTRALLGALCAELGDDQLTEAATSLMTLARRVTNARAEGPRFEGSAPQEALLSVVDVAVGRLLAREPWIGVEARQVEVLQLLGQRMMAAFTREDVAACAETVERLSSLNSDQASDAAFALLGRHRTWLVHPLVVYQVSRWRRAHLRSKARGYLPLRELRPGGTVARDAHRLESFFDLLQAYDAQGDKLDVDRFESLYLEVLKQVAEARAAFEAWRGQTDSVVERLSEGARAERLREALRSPTWLHDSTLAQVCADRFHDRKCIRQELLVQYRHNRTSLAERTVRGWVTKYIREGGRSIPAAAMESLRAKPPETYLR